MSTNTKITASVSMTLLTCFGLSSVAHADPLPGEVLKFQQLPLFNTTVGTTPYPGHAEQSTAYQYINSSGLVAWKGSFAADDFADKLSTPVVHLKWWGDYLANPNNSSVNQFLISFESDVPAVPPQNGVPGIPSHPGSPILSQIVTAGTPQAGNGQFSEAPDTPGSTLMKYNAELNLTQQFPELKDTVYWVKIVALVDQATQGNLSWGWHNRNYMVQDTFASPVPIPGETQIGPAFQPMWHFQDDAVRGFVDINPIVPGGLFVDQTQAPMIPSVYIDGIDGPGGPAPGQGIGGYSQDLAFELYTGPVPEPATLGVFAMIGGVLLMNRQQRRHAA